MLKGPLLEAITTFIQALAEYQGKCLWIQAKEGLTWFFMEGVPFSLRNSLSGYLEEHFPAVKVEWPENVSLVHLFGSAFDAETPPLQGICACLSGVSYSRKRVVRLLNDSAQYSPVKVVVDGQHFRPRRGFTMSDYRSGLLLRGKLSSGKRFLKIVPSTSEVVQWNKKLSTRQHPHSLVALPLEFKGAHRYPFIGSGLDWHIPTWGKSEPEELPFLPVAASVTLLADWKRKTRVDIVVGGIIVRTYEPDGFPTGLKIAMTGCPGSHQMLGEGICSDPKALALRFSDLKVMQTHLIKHFQNHYPAKSLEASIAWALSGCRKTSLYRLGDWGLGSNRKEN